MKSAVIAGVVVLALGVIFERACWGPPGGPRPTEFESRPGSQRILQYWEKIGPVPRS